MEHLPALAGSQNHTPILHSLNGQLGQFLERYTHHSKYLDEQIGPLLAQCPRRGQQTQVFIPGQFRLDGIHGLELHRELVFPQPQISQEPIGRGDPVVHCPGHIAVFQHGVPPVGNRSPIQPFVRRQEPKENREVPPVGLDALRRTSPCLHVRQIVADLLPCNSIRLFPLLSFCRLYHVDHLRPFLRRRQTSQFVTCAMQTGIGQTSQIVRQRPV